MADDDEGACLPPGCALAHSWHVPAAVAVEGVASAMASPMCAARAVLQLAWLHAQRSGGGTRDAL